MREIERKKDLLTGLMFSSIARLNMSDMTSFWNCSETERGGQRESETEKEALIMREKETERPTDKVHLLEHSASEHVGHVLLLERFERLANA